MNADRAPDDTEPTPQSTFDRIRALIKREQEARLKQAWEEATRPKLPKPRKPPRKSVSKRKPDKPRTPTGAAGARRGWPEKRAEVVKAAAEFQFWFASPSDIAARRKQLGLSQADFWGRVMIMQAAGCRYEKSRNIPLPVQVLLQITYGDAQQSANTVRLLRRGQRQRASAEGSGKEQPAAQAQPTSAGAPDGEPDSLWFSGPLPTGLYPLRRHGQLAGWIVHLTRRGATVQRQFWASTHGGMESAFRAASALRDEVEREFPPLSVTERCATRRADNASGVPGVGRRKIEGREYWAAEMRVGKTRRIRTFSIAAHGEERAFQLAVEARRMLLETLDGAEAARREASTTGADRPLPLARPSLAGRAPIKPDVAVKAR